MTRKTTSFLLTVAMLGLAAVLLFVAGPPGAKSEPKAASSKRGRTILVSGEGAVQTRPDRAWALLGVESISFDPTDALHRAMSRTDAVEEQLKSLGLNQNDIQKLSPRISREPDGYRGLQTIRIKTENAAGLPEIVERALASGASTIDGVVFGVSNEADFRRQAVERAIKDARIRAEEAAVSEKATVGEITALEIDYPDSDRSEPEGILVKAKVRATFAVEP